MLILNHCFVQFNNLTVKGLRMRQLHITCYLVSERHDFTFCDVELCELRREVAKATAWVMFPGIVNCIQLRLGSLTTPSYEKEFAGDFNELMMYLRRYGEADLPMICNAGSIDAQEMNMLREAVAGLSDARDGSVPAQFLMQSAASV